MDRDNRRWEKETMGPRNSGGREDFYQEGGYGWGGAYDRGGWVGSQDFEGAAGPHVGRGPRGYQRSDERIREDVCDVLTHHGQIDATDIEVTVEDGEVTLAGTVDSRRAKRLAEDVVDGVRGVRDVHNRLRVSGGSSGNGLSGRSMGDDMGHGSDVVQQEGMSGSASEVAQ